MRFLPVIFLHFFLPIFAVAHGPLECAEDFSALEAKNPKLFEARIQKENFPAKVQENLVAYSLAPGNKMTEKEFNSFLSALKAEKNPEQQELLSSYIHYLPHDPAAQTERGVATRLWEEVASLENLNSLEKKTAKDLEKKFPQLPEVFRNQIAKGTKEARRTRIKQCMFPMAGQESSMKLFQGAAIGLGAGMTSVSYPYYHWKEEKNAKWFGKLAYELSIGIAMNAVTGKIMGKPTGTFGEKVMKQWWGAARVGLVDLGLYSILFGKNTEETQKILDDLKKDPNFEANMAKLKATLEDPRYIQKLKLQAGDLLEKAAVKLKLEKNAKSNAEVLAEWDKITPDKLSDEEIAETLREAMEIQLYEQKESLVKSGDAGVDRYNFNRAWDVPGYAWWTGVNLLIYRSICLNKENKTKALAKAALLYLMSRSITDNVYFPGRKAAVGL